MNGDRERPVVRCLVALTFGSGHVFRRTFHVRLENVPKYLSWGLSVVGPDPEDMIALATWEREQELRQRPS